MALFCNRADGVPFVVVAWINHRVPGQFQQALEKRMILRVWIAILKVSPTRSPDQQRIACKNPVIHQEAVTLRSVPRSIQRSKRKAFDR